MFSAVSIFFASSLQIAILRFVDYFCRYYKLVPNCKFVSSAKLNKNSTTGNFMKMAKRISKNFCHFHKFFRFPYQVNCFGQNREFLCFYSVQKWLNFAVIFAIFVFFLANLSSDAYSINQYETLISEEF